MRHASKVFIATSLPPGWKPGDRLTAVVPEEPPARSIRRSSEPGIKAARHAAATMLTPVVRTVVEPDDAGCYVERGPFLPCRLCEARRDGRQPSFSPKSQRWNADADAFRLLWRAVLDAAFAEATGAALMNEPADQWPALRAQAREWFAHDCDRPFSMVWIAHGLNLSAVHIRKTLAEALRRGRIVRSSRGIVKDAVPNFRREYIGPSEYSIDGRAVHGKVRTLEDMSMQERAAICFRFAERGQATGIFW